MVLVVKSESRYLMGNLYVMGAGLFMPLPGSVRIKS